MEIIKKIAQSVLTSACVTGLIIFIVWIIVSLSSCSGASNGEENTETSKCPFVSVAEGMEGAINWEVLVDKETRVMYICIRQRITVMLEADGTPKLWTGELPE